VFTIGVMYYFFLTNGKDEALNTLLKNMLPGFAAGLIGLFGFLISGLAVLTGMISKRVTVLIDDKKASHALLELLFSFFFEGAIIAACIVGIVFAYIILHIDQPTIIGLFISYGLILAYFFWFSILYGVGLIGTCINIFFLNVKCEIEIEKREKNRKRILYKRRGEK